MPVNNEYVNLVQGTVINCYLLHPLPSPRVKFVPLQATQDRVSFTTLHVTTGTLQLYCQIFASLMERNRWIVTGWSHEMYYLNFKHKKPFLPESRKISN